ncbi:MAG: hypothetical protein MPL62_08355 [Alphaproteobacteria bacterium]|nr:hypothetical protein [Alphaproteobacteria bacterium]
MTKTFTIAAQANRTRRWLAALPPKKLKNNEKTIYLIDTINCLLIINRINYFDPLNSPIAF